MTEQSKIIKRMLAKDFAGVAAALEEKQESINDRLSNNGVTPLMIAAGWGMTEMVDFLLSRDGLDLSMRDFNGRTAAEHARPHPDILVKITSAMFPNWREPR